MTKSATKENIENERDEVDVEDDDSFTESSEPAAPGTARDGMAAHLVVRQNQLTIDPIG